MLGTKVIMSNSTKVFIVPSATEYENTDDDGFAVGTYSAFVSGSSYTIEAYNTSDSIPYAEVVVKVGPTGLKKENVSSFMLVSDIGMKWLEDEGINTVYVKGLRGGKEETLYCANSYDVVLNGLEEGDLALFGFNKDNRINDMIILYDYSKRKVNQSYSKLHTSSRTVSQGISARTVYGYVNSVRGSVIRWGYDKADQIDEVADVSGLNIMIYDGSRKTDKAYIGTINDVAAYEYESSSPSEIYLSVKYGKAQYVAIYK